MGISLTPEERFEVFGEHDPSEFAAEVEARWGDTPLLREARQRARSYGKADWLRIKDEAAAIEAAFVAALQAGVAPQSPQAMDVAEAHRAHISRWFYECSVQMHKGLAEMYLADERFRNHYDSQAEGLAEYVSAAILANVERQRQ